MRRGGDNLARRNNTQKQRLSPVDIAVLTHSMKRGKDWLSGLLNNVNTGFPIIFSPEMMALLIHRPRSVGSYVCFVHDLMRVANHPEQYWLEYRIKQANGKNRDISESCGKLRFYQKWLLQHVIAHMEIDDHATAYHKGATLKRNAAPHVGRDKWLVKLDIKHFFESCSAGMVYRLFLSYGYPPAVAMICRQFTTYKGALPMGAATSPAISNALLCNFDRAVAAFCAEREIAYTRYSDDMTFSSEKKVDVHELVAFVRNALEKVGNLRLNYSKTVVVPPKGKRSVCGLTVNEKVSVDRQYKRKVRQEVYFLEKCDSIEEHLLHRSDCAKYKRKNGELDTVYYLYNLLGRVTFVLSVQPDLEEFRRYKSLLLDRISTEQVNEDELRLRKLDLRSTFC